MHSGTSKLMAESTLKLVTRMRRETTTADLIQTTLELQIRVRKVKILRFQGQAGLKQGWESLARAKVSPAKRDKLLCGRE